MPVGPAKSQPEMNWRKGLLRLWVVASALWIVSVAAFEWTFGTEEAVSAELYAKYSYYRIMHPDSVAKKRQLISDFDDPKSPAYCVSHEQRERQKARLAELETTKAKRPLAPPPQKPPGTYGLYGILESTAKAPIAKPPTAHGPPMNAGGHILSDQEVDALVSGLEADQIRLSMRVPECTADVAKAMSDLRDVIDWDDIPDWGRGTLLSLAYWMFGPPIAVFTLGKSLVWAFRG